MKKYFYPSIFHEKDGGYWVEFPGLEGCMTQGDSFDEAYSMATESLGLFLQAENGEFYTPEPDKISKEQIPEDGFLVMVEFDEVEYLKHTNSQSVKKTLTIPKWLDVLAMRHNINFSQTLQNAIIKKLSDE